MAARDVRAQRVETVVLLGGRVEGEVHAVIGTRHALAAALLGGLLAGLILTLARGVFGRD